MALYSLLKDYTRSLIFVFYKKKNVKYDYKIKFEKIYNITILIKIVIFEIVAINRVVVYLNSTANVKADDATGNNIPIKIVYRNI